MFRPMHAEKGRGSPANAKPLQAARTWLGEQGAAILDEQIELARVPAPPFQEYVRAELIAGKLASFGVDAVFDEIGNLLAWFPSESRAHERSPVIVATHVDTVFGPEIPIEIRAIGERWVGPGITDNARGLAVALAVLRALIGAGVEPQRPILFAFTVGEEGSGDLRGVKHLLREGSAPRAASAFIAVDGSGLRRIIHHALGSLRFRVTVEGPGGHSWTDWGRANPAVAIGEFIHRIAELNLPTEPRTTLTVARLGGGTGINAIPVEAWLELDLRSVSDETLRSTERRIREALAVSLVAERERGQGTLSVESQLIGERPAGSLPASHPLVQAADQATRTLGEEPEHAVSSTDANVPLALGIPAIAVGAGGSAGDTHTLNEWFEESDGASGALRLLAILASVAGF